MQQTTEPLLVPVILPPTSIALPRMVTGYTLPLVALGVLLLAGGALVASLTTAPPAQQKLSAFSTSLKGRSLNQRRNALLAARSIDGRVVAPHGVFSFNQTVRSWSVDQGYVKALVSYDGELVRAYGGGVCQTSTTLYNAALLAGLPILERHPHVFVPHYIVPGRDAAVAFPGIDLRFRNSNPWPIRIHAIVRGDRLEVSLTGAKTPPQKVAIKTEMLSVSTPLRLTRVVNRKSDVPSPARRTYIHSAGTAGYRVVTLRVFSSGRRESLSDDTYPAMNRVIALSREVPQSE
ncbi:vancomycin B-type resistance protein VanW [Abditibacteriota bacterium]|nr:vancomycin B-type resistance protein VanW [Abditibacteriota bacterium]